MPNYLNQIYFFFILFFYFFIVKHTQTLTHTYNIHTNKYTQIHTNTHKYKQIHTHLFSHTYTQIHKPANTTQSRFFSGMSNSRFFSPNSRFFSGMSKMHVEPASYILLT